MGEVTPTIEPSVPEDIYSITPEEEAPDQYTEEELDACLLRIKEEFEQEDEYARDKHLRKLKKADLYWQGEQKIYWSAAQDTYLSVNGLSFSDKEEYGIVDFDRVVNVYKPLGESVIAALSTGIPNVNFFPDDADNPDDIITAKAYGKIAELIQKHNRASLLFIKALFTIYNQGLVCGYNYTHTDYNYGTFDIEQEIEPSRMESKIEEDPETGELMEVQNTVPPVVGVSKEPKAREMLAIYGPLHVHVPSWCREQKDIPILKLSFEQHESLVRSIYADKWDEIRGSKGDYGAQSGREARSRTRENESDLVTVEVCWIRPWHFAVETKDKYNYLIKKYPDGVKIVVANKTVLEKTGEALDDHWTLTFPIMSEGLNCESMGSGAIDIQELRNDAINLADQTIRHAIPETFADSEVLDFEKYQNTERRPGQIFPVKMPPGQPIGAAFHSLRTASLSQELDVFIKRLDQDGQFVVGAFPSIYGGPNIGGSKTFAEYSMSRSQALQRLSTYWKMLGSFWSDYIGRASRQFAKNLLSQGYDEKFVKKAGGSFVNAWITRAELMGKVGSVEPEASENFPITASQKREMLMHILELKHESIQNVLFNPENVQTVQDALGFPDFYIPGADDRNKQLYEIQALITQEPSGPDEASVPIEPDIDDEPVHIQTMKAFLVGETGQMLKTTNPPGYMNCLFHLKAHTASVEGKLQKSQAQAQPQPETNASQQ